MCGVTKSHWNVEHQHSAEHHGTLAAKLAAARLRGFALSIGRFVGSYLSNLLQTFVQWRLNLLRLRHMRHRRGARCRSSSFRSK